MLNNSTMQKLTYSLILLLSVVFFACKEKKPTTPSTPVVEKDTTSVVVEDTVVQDTVMVEELEPEEEIVVEEATGPYYVVVSSFVNEQNAQKTLTKYKDLGYPAGIISRPKGRNPEFLRVYLAQSSDKKEALKLARDISRQLDVRAWVLVNP